MASVDISTEATAFRGAVVEASGTESVVTLDRDRIYTVTHLGLEDDGTTASTGAVYLADGAAPTTTFAASANKWILRDGKAVVIGPGVKDLRVKTASGSPMISFEPSLPLFGQY